MTASGSVEIPKVSVDKVIGFKAIEILGIFLNFFAKALSIRFLKFHYSLVRILGFNTGWITGPKWPTHFFFYIEAYLAITVHVCTDFL